MLLLYRILESLPLHAFGIYYMFQWWLFSILRFGVAGLPLILALLHHTTIVAMNSINSTNSIINTTINSSTCSFATSFVKVVEYVLLQFELLKHFCWLYLGQNSSLLLLYRYNLPFLKTSMHFRAFYFYQYIADYQFISY